MHVFSVLEREGKTSESNPCHFPSFSDCLAIERDSYLKLFLNRHIKAFGFYSALSLSGNTARNAFLYPCFVFFLSLYMYIPPYVL